MTLTDGYWAVAMGAAAHRSIELGRPVELAEIMDARHMTAFDTTDPKGASR